LLSYFALKAGAKRVYAIEGSTLAFDTKAVVEVNNCNCYDILMIFFLFKTIILKENGLSDRLIVYHARMEDVELPEKVKFSIQSNI
jgi:hypothetical protein